MEAFIIVKNLYKEFIRGDPAYLDISLTIKEGQSFGILGKSGAGKSALMHALRGTPEYEPTRGTVTYRISFCPNKECYRVEYPSQAGEPCPLCKTTLELREIDFWAESKKNSPVYRSLYNRVSVMLQRTFALYGEYPVIENIKEALANAGYPERRREGLAATLLTRVKMTHRAVHLARDLSGGEKQRVVFAINLAKRPLLFLADEPSGTLDVVTAEQIHKVMTRAVEKEGLTLIVTSHWPEAVEQLTKEAILLEKGKITMQGNSSDVAKEFLSKVKKVELPERTFQNEIIHVRDVYKHYYAFDRGIIKAVDGVDLNIMDGEIFGIVGVSGSGKTSLAHMICGLKTITKGVIEVKVGEEWINMAIPGPMERGRATKYMGILHQEYALYPHRTILENLTGAISYALPEEMKTKKAYEVLRAVNFTSDEIDNILYKFPDQVSEGERHRVAIARILIREPKIILLDEATGTADPLTRAQITESIINSREVLKQTYLIISHDIGFIEGACDRACLMRDGHIIEIGKPKDVIHMLRTYQEKIMT